MAYFQVALCFQIVEKFKYVKENLPLKLFFFSRQLRLLRHDQIPNSHLPHLVHFLGLEIIKQEHPNYVPFNHIFLSVNRIFTYCINHLVVTSLP